MTLKPAVQVALGRKTLPHRRILRFAVYANLKIEIRDLGSNRSHSRLQFRTAGSGSPLLTFSLTKPSKILSFISIFREK